MLLIIDGAFGRIKSTFERAISSASLQCELIPKKHVSAPDYFHKDLSTDLVPVTQSYFEGLSPIRLEGRNMTLTGYIKYTLGEGSNQKSYAIDVECIWSALRSNRHAVVFVRDLGAIASLKKVFGQRCRVVFVQTSRAQLEEDYKGKGDIDIRLQLAESAISDFSHNPEKYDRVILNAKVDDTAVMKQIYTLIAKYDPDYTKHFLRTGDVKVTVPVPVTTAVFNDVVEKVDQCGEYEKNVFVMTTFSEQEISNVRPVVKDAFSAAKNAFGENFSPIYANEVFDTEDRTAPMATSLMCSRGIALFLPGSFLKSSDSKMEARHAYNDTDWKLWASVVYELGLMEQQRKTCLVLIPKSASEVFIEGNKLNNRLPFYVESKLVKPYNSIEDIKSLIEKWLSKTANWRA